MTYTFIAALAVAAAVLSDLFVLRTGLVRRREFWIAYAIMVGFQLLTNAVLTGREVVQYADATVVGTGNDVPGFTPSPFGDGRLLYAPFEDLVFGFALIVWTLSLWDFWGRRGMQAEPVSGPPRWRHR